MIGLALLGSHDLLGPFIPLAVYLVTCFLCVIHSMRGEKKQKNHKIYLYVYNSACAEALLQLGRCFDLCQTSFICRKSEFRLTFEVAPIEVQSSCSCIHIFPVDQSIKYELKRMFQDKCNGTVMNLS